MGRRSKKKAAHRREAQQAASRPARRSNAWKLGMAGVWMLLVGGLVALLVLSSSGSDGSGASAGLGSGGGGGKVASFAVTDIDGERVSRPAGRPGALFFMAGWCGTCISEAEALAELKDEHGGAIEVLAVSIDPSDTVENIRSFIEITGASSYPFHWDREGRLTGRYEVRALDTTIVYDARGAIVYRDAAPTDSDTLEAALEEAGLS